MQLPTAEQIEQAFIQITDEGLPPKDALTELGNSPALRYVVDLCTQGTLLVLKDVYPEMTAQHIRPGFLGAVATSILLGLAIKRPEPPPLEYSA